MFFLEQFIHNMEDITGTSSYLSLVEHSKYYNKTCILV